jgi:hypothetical protein
MNCPKCNEVIYKTDKTCKNCGFENEYYDENAINFEAIKYTKYKKEKRIIEDPLLSILALVFAFFYNIVGIILGVIGLLSYQNSFLARRCKNSIIIGSVIMGIKLLILILVIIYNINN